MNLTYVENKNVGLRWHIWYVLDIQESEKIVSVMLYSNSTVKVNQVIQKSKILAKKARKKTRSGPRKKEENKIST